jgi:isocitrate/isopropylmalate dehydrogenase
MKILVFECDGIGHEIVPAAVTTLEALSRRLNLGLTFEQAEIGLDCLESAGTTVPPDTLEKMRGWLGHKHDRPELREAARRLDGALDAQLSDKAGRTPDLGGGLGTDVFCAAVAERILSGPAPD